MGGDVLTNKYQMTIYGLELLLFIYQIAIEGLQAFGASQVVLVVENPPANVRHVGSIPGSGRPPEEGMATHSSILARRTTWTEKSGRLQSMGSQRVKRD